MIGRVNYSQPLVWVDRWLGWAGRAGLVKLIVTLLFGWGYIIVHDPDPLDPDPDPLDPHPDPDPDPQLLAGWLAGLAGSAGLVKLIVIFF